MTRGSPNRPPIGRFRPYPEYKDSGVEWLNQYPTHWAALPLKRLVATKITDGPHETPPLWNDGVQFISAEALCNGKIDFERRRGFISPTLHEQYSRKCRTLRNDILVCKSGATTGKLAMVEVDFAFSIWSPLAVVRANQSRALPRWLALTLESDYVQEQIRRTWSAGTQPNISMGDLEKIFIAIPPVAEQDGIICLLNRETAKIDALVAKKKRLIELLQEKRTALITQAVTKGLDPNVPMNDSGVEWLGQIPAHWGDRKMGYLMDMVSGGTPDKENPAYWRGDIPWVSPKDMKKRIITDATDHVSGSALRETGLQLVSPPVVLIVVRGMILAHTFPVAYTAAPVTLNQDMKALKLMPGIDANFFVYLLEGIGRIVLSLVEEAGHGTKRLRTDYWRAIRVFLPPRQEQRRIAEHLDWQMEVVQRLENRVYQGVERLREYRSALISAAVTGKIDVREEVA